MTVYRYQPKGTFSGLGDYKFATYTRDAFHAAKLTITPFLSNFIYKKAPLIHRNKRFNLRVRVRHCWANICLVIALYHREIIALSVGLCSKLPDWSLKRFGASFMLCQG